MVNQTKILFSFVFFVFSLTTVVSQAKTFHPTDKFRNFTIVNLPASMIKQDINEQRSEIKDIKIGTWEMSLFSSEILSPKYKLRVGTSEGIREEKSSKPLAMNGYTRQGGRVSLTINENFIYGFVEANHTTYFIEPLYHFNKNAQKDEFILYDVKDIIQTEPHTCGATQIGVAPEVDGHHSNNKGERTGACFEVAYAIASDFLMFNDYGSVTAVENHAIGVINNVQTNYDDEFADELQFTVVEQFVSNCSTCDPWSSSTNAETLLNSFTNWAPNGFSSGHAVGSIWTGRDFAGSTIGIAWLGGVCTSIGYNALQDFSSDAELKRVMVSHELGHNFDAQHDGSGSPHIMAPTVQYTDTWSPASINAIEDFYLSSNCLGSCSPTSAPLADFTSDITSPCQPGQVEFTDNSSGTISFWHWQFEGGSPTTSNQQNPTINYINPGVYSVTLTVGNGSNSNTLVKTDEIEISPVPDADFDYDINAGSVDFTNTSLNGNNASFFWNFGDGGTSSSENPQHTYSQDGTYIVELTVDNVCGFDIRTQTITIATPPSANFIANSTSNCGTFEVTFTSTSSSNVTGYNWQFPGGNPSSSTLQNPVITYNTPGSYPVTLTVSNAQGSNTLSIPNFITAYALPSASFTYNQAGLTFSFNNTSQNSSSYLWNFGDGQTSTNINPVHTYTSSGNFTITLSASNANCPASLSNQNVSATTLPVSAFTVSANTGCVAHTATFTSTSLNNPDSFIWSFEGGEPATSTEEHPVITYANPGTFDVSLITTNGLGSDTLVLPNYMDIHTTPTANFLANGTGTTFSFNNQSSGGLFYLWNFGDGSTSEIENPSHTYTTENNYVVSLEATNECGTTSTQLSVNAYVIPVAELGASTVSVCPGEEVVFNDLSTGVVQIRKWIFEGGNPNTSENAQMPVAYTDSGNYDVTLIVGNPAGNDTVKLENYILVKSLPQTSFSTSVTDLTITLINTSVGGNSILWNLPDGSTSTNDTISYLAPENGNYNFTLQTSNDCGSTSNTQQISINSVPNADFNSSFNGQNNCAPLSVNYTAPYILGAEYNWTFEGGNPSSSNEQNPSISYADGGSFDVSLIVSNTIGADTLMIENFINAIGSPNGDYNFSTTNSMTQFNYTGDSGVTFSWDFAGLGTSNEMNPQFTFPSDGNYEVQLIISNICANDTIKKVIEIMTTDTKDHATTDNYLLFPNPVSDFLKITKGKPNDANLEIVVLDIFGQIVKRVEWSSGKTFNMETANLLSGQYTLGVFDGETTKYLRFIKI